MSVLALSIVKQGDNEIEGLTDTTVPKRLGPKRANHIRKFFGLTKEDDVRDFVVRREVTKGDKTYTKAPKIQRLVTPQTLQRKRALKAKKSRMLNNKEMLLLNTLNCWLRDCMKEKKKELKLKRRELNL